MQQTQRNSISSLISCYAMVHLIDWVMMVHVLKNLEQIRRKHNEEFVNKELEEQKEFFDTILDYPLDDQQRDSIVSLVVSSVGSGKTSTMIGKLLCLVHQRKIQPSCILTITYTHKASDELTQRLLGTGLSCMTFHKFAMTIVAKVEGKMPSIADNGLFIKVFYDQMSKPEFRTAILNYLTDYKSLVMNEHDYNSSIEYYCDRKKYGVITLYTEKEHAKLWFKELNGIGSTAENLAVKNIIIAAKELMTRKLFLNR